jgi:hypothetical protein
VAFSRVTGPMGSFARCSGAVVWGTRGAFANGWNQGCSTLFT